MGSLVNTAKIIADGFSNGLEVSTVTVFLAGGNRIGGKSIRSALRKKLSRRPYVRGYDVLYPEDLFDEIMAQRKHHDLLSLEDMLARSAHAIIIVVEGPGSIAELGAFVSNDILCQKLVAVINEKHRNDKSFIMLGPVAKLRNLRRESVVMHNMEQPNVEGLAVDIRRAVRSIMRTTSVDVTLNNPVRAQYFVLASVLVAEPAPLKLLEQLLAATNECDSMHVDVVAATALNILLRRGDVALDVGFYRITPKGLGRLRDIIRQAKDGRRFVRAFDLGRIEILNDSRRKRKNEASI